MSIVTGKNRKNKNNCLYIKLLTLSVMYIWNIFPDLLFTCWIFVYFAFCFGGFLPFSFTFFHMLFHIHIGVCPCIVLFLWFVCSCTKIHSFNYCSYIPGKASSPHTFLFGNVTSYFFMFILTGEIVSNPKCWDCVKFMDTFGEN